MVRTRSSLGPKSELLPTDQENVSTANRKRRSTATCANPLKSCANDKPHCLGNHNTILPTKLRITTSIQDERANSSSHNDCSEDFEFRGDLDVPMVEHCTHRIAVTHGIDRNDTTKSEIIGEARAQKLEESDSDIESVSQYEKMRDRNIQENAEFFKSLGILEAKEQLLPSKPKPTQRGLKREKSPPAPRRVSMRLRRIDPDGVALPPEQVIAAADSEDDNPRPPAGPLQMREVLMKTEDASLHEHLLEKMRCILKEKLPDPLETQREVPLNDFIKTFGKFRITEKQVAKVVPSRSFSLAIHPTEEKVLACTGDKWGKVGIWDVMSTDRQEGVVVYKPHCRPVNCLMIQAHSPDKIYSCSYDGSLRCGYFEKELFDDVYSTPEDDNILLRNFEFLSPSTMMVSQSDGCVSIIDCRTTSTSPDMCYKLHEKSLRCVTIHPLKPHCIATSSVDGTVCIWDTRHLHTGRKRNNCLKKLPHGRSVSSVYFSPISGQYLLSTSLDDKIRIFDCTSEANPEVKSFIRHDNHVGQWLTNFRATWHPQRDDVFVVGSMVRPRQIELYDTKGLLVKVLKSTDHLASVCSINVFHPTRNILVGANSSGRLHVFIN